MKKIITATRPSHPVFLILFIFSSSAFAISPFPAINNFSIITSAGSSHYQEPSNGQPDLAINGQHYAIEFGYENYHPNGFLLSLTQSIGIGPVNYHSYSGLGDITNARDTLFNTRLLSGFTAFNSQKVALIPYIGLGYRNLHDNLAAGSINTTTGDHFPLRVIDYWYTPIGGFLVNQLTQKIMLKTQFEYDLFWHGNVTTNSFDVDGMTLPQITNSQTNGYGLRGSIALLIPKGHELFSIGPYVHYWNIKASNTVTNSGTDYTEPSNSTLEIGAEAGVIF